MRLRDLKRRTYLSTVVAGVSGLAGCSSDPNSASDEDTTDIATDTPEQSSEDGGKSSADDHGPDIKLIEVLIEEDAIAVGDPIKITALVSNTGDATGRYEADLQAGEITATKETDVPAGGESQLEFNLRFDEPGTVSLTINDSVVTDITVNERNVFYVSVDGDDSNTGAESDPLRTIQQGLNRAKPGHTVEVTAGEYHEGDTPEEVLKTVRHGEPDAPITITGPEDAILRPSFQIRHSHIRLTGLTIEGLVDPDNPDDPESYYQKTDPIFISPSHKKDEYLRDIVCAPHGVGYGANGLINVFRTIGLDIGPLEVTGIAGAAWILPNKPNKHAGEIVYLGSPPGIVYEDFYPWYGLDQTRDVHIHHIDNSSGHPHSELVDAKLGTRNVLIEYCTDGGGSQITEPYNGCSIGLRGHDATVRWCELRDGDGHGFKLTDSTEWLKEHEDSVIDPEENPDNSIYGNTIAGFDVTAIELHGSLAEQGTICGNDISEPDDLSVPTDKSATDSCPAEIPDGDGIGHLGGESPFTDN